MLFGSYSNLNLVSFNNFIHNGSNIVLINANYLLEENFIDFTLINIWFSNPYISFPFVFNNYVRQAIKLYPSVCRLINISYKSMLYFICHFFTIGNKTTKKVISFDGIPTMTGSIRCNYQVIKKVFNSRKFDNYINSIGIFLINGKERVIRSTFSLRTNSFFNIKVKSKNRSYKQTESNIVYVSENMRNNHKTMKLVYDKNDHIYLHIKMADFYLEIPFEFILVLLSNKQEIEYNNFNCNKFDKKVDDGSFLNIYYITNFIRNIKQLLINIYPIDCTYIMSVLKNALKNKVNMKDYLKSEDYIYIFLKYFIFIDYSSIKSKKNMLIELVTLEINNKIENNEVDNLHSINYSKLILNGDFIQFSFKMGISSTLKMFKKLSIHTHNNSPIIKFLDYRKLKCYFFDKLLNPTDKLCELVSKGLYHRKNSLKNFIYGCSIQLDRINEINHRSYFDLIHSGIFYKNKEISLRKQSFENYGFVCPIHTPDGFSSGLINHVSISVYFNEISVLSTKPLTKLAVELIDNFNGIHLDNNRIVNGLSKVVIYINIKSIISKMINEKIKKLIHFVHYIKAFNLSSFRKIAGIQYYKRRICYKFIFLSLSYSFGKMTQWNAINLYSINNGMSKILKQIGNCNFETVNTNQYYTLKIKRFDQYLLTTSRYYTHEEYGFDFLNSFASSLIPFSNHNQSPRNIYQCQMSKHSIGIPCENQLFRRNTKLLFLSYVQTPIISNRNFTTSALSKVPCGINFCVVIMTYSGYNIEDALLINKSAGQRSLMSLLIYISKCGDLQTFYQSVKDEKKTVSYNSFCRNYYTYFNTISKASTLFLYKFLKKKRTHINKYRLMIYDKKNFVCKNNMLKYVYFNRQQQLIKKKNVFLYSISFVEQFRSIVPGDKVASMHGQKSVISILSETVDIPFDSNLGIISDISMNPHSFPSRMTIGMLKEILYSKTLVQIGKVYKIDNYQYKINFSYDKIIDFSEFLKINNPTFVTNSKMIDARNGTMINSTKLTGLSYYQRLPQMVLDKYQYRNYGPINVKTKQPVKGRKFKGGLKIGEMEKDAILSHGCLFLLRERMINSCDYVISIYCSSCKCFYLFKNPRQKTLKKSICCSNPSTKVVLLPYILIFLIYELKMHDIELLFYFGF